MALEYTFEAAAAVEADELFGFFRQLTGAEVVDLGDPFLRTAGMDITPYAVDPDSPREKEDYVPGAGFRPRVRVEFRMRNVADDASLELAHAVMLRSVLAFLASNPGDAVLLYNHERIIFARNGSDIVFDEWEGFDDNPAMHAVVAQFPRRKLEQPFL